MAKLKIIRASAGSGKTYKLTEEILATLINKPNNYFKHILAVTFTNKATAEMKNRILDELYILSSNKNSDHLEKLMEISKKSENEIRNKAKIILERILHGYSWFRVETIDTFFQGIIRTFVREIGIAGNYSIELDQEKILKEAIDRLLNTISEDETTLSWLLDHIDLKIAEGKSWNITNELLDLGKTLFHENLIVKMPLIHGLLKESEFLIAYRNALNEIKQSFENKILNQVDKALKKIKENNLSAADFAHGERGPIGYLAKLRKKQFEQPGVNVCKVLDSGKWASGKCTRKSDAEFIGVNTIAPAITNIKELFNKEAVDYHTSTAILQNIHIVGLLSRLNDELSNIREDKSIFLISDASPFIQKIINNNDTPFIYEKAGNHFNHIFIDEFQDTSGMQWDNFKPLITNSLSKDNNCLLVGDVKQAIYRWRGSNWNILESQVKKEFHSEFLDEICLETNWRSDKNIVEFNNSFFKHTSIFLNQLLSENTTALIPPSEIYKDVAQEMPPRNQSDSGYISIKVFNKDEVKNEDYYFNELTNRINEVLKQGYNPGDIAVLIRNKKEGTLLANSLINANIQGLFCKKTGVISNESLFLCNSTAVKAILSAMNFINTPDSELHAGELLTNYLQLSGNYKNNIIPFPEGKFTINALNKYIANNFIDSCLALKQESLYVIAERLSTLLKIYNTETELVYIHSFLDLIFDFTNSEQSDLNSFLNFWNEEGKNKTISAAETAGSIKILTIHKSKGLEFPIVILPFAGWSIVPKSNEKLWLEPHESPYNKLPFLPVNYKNELSESYFKPDFELENYLTLIDNLNLLYVAFTRAENALITFLSDEGEKNKNINELIINTLHTLKSEIPISFNEMDNIYTVGQIKEKTTTKNISSSKLMPVNPPLGSIPMVRISSKYEDFMSKESINKNPLTFGRILHSIMEDCVHKKDVVKAVQKKVEEGILSKDEGIETKNLLMNALSMEKAAPWFENKYTVLTEADIISPGGNTKRPDRVMIGTNEAIVIDYKFGQEDEKPKHIKQVKEYMNLIKETGIEKVSGYLWYIMANDIIEI